MTEQLPARLRSGGVTPAAVCSTSYMVPALIAEIGAQAAWRYVEFFAANIRNPNTRRAWGIGTSQSCRSLGTLEGNDRGGAVQIIHRLLIEVEFHCWQPARGQHPLLPHLRAIGDTIGSARCSCERRQRSRMRGALRHE